MAEKHNCKRYAKLFKFLEPCVGHCFRCGEIYCPICLIRENQYIVSEEPDIIIKFCSNECYDQFIIDEANEWVVVDGSTSTPKAPDGRRG
jgi:hypothetical protein